MHPDIVLWPNKYFYGGILNTGTSKMENKLVPYLFLDVEGEAVTERGNCCNKSEERVIIDLVKTIRDIHGKTPNMGIITFYSKQKTNISLELQNQKLNSARIAVNTVDGFQVDLSVGFNSTIKIYHRVKKNATIEDLMLSGMVIL